MPDLASLTATYSNLPAVRILPILGIAARNAIVVSLSPTSRNAGRCVQRYLP